MACMLYLAGLSSLANSTDQISDADVERVRREMPSVTDADVERVMRSRVIPPHGAGDSAAPPVASPRVDALPSPAISPPADLSAVARGFEMTEESVRAARAALSDEPALLVFVSFSIPEASLQRLVAQAERASATLVLRGPTRSSLKETVLAVQRLIGKRRVAFQIDPQAFERYGIEVAPSFVVVKAGVGVSTCSERSCMPSGAFVSVSGDVSVDYALEQMQNRSSVLHDEISHFLNRLRG